VLPVSLVGASAQRPDQGLPGRHGSGQLAADFPFCRGPRRGL
jgi:hypothetical protein